MELGMQLLCNLLISFHGNNNSFMNKRLLWQQIICHLGRHFGFLYSYGFSKFSYLKYKKIVIKKCFKR